MDKIWEKISYWVGLLPVGALLGVAVYAASLEVKDFDLWLHIATGRFILENGYIPSVDVLSFSVAGRPWINHEWLFQVIVYSLYQAFGPDGLIRMQIGLVALTMFILFLLGWSKEKYLVATFGLILMFMNYQQRFTIRPDLFSLLFFALYIYALALHINKRWIVPFLTVIQVLWSNMHGFFFFGPLFVLIGLFSEWLKRHVRLPYEWNDSGRLTDEEYKRLKVILLCVVLACLLNPQFVHGAFYPVGIFFSLSGDSKIFFDHIQELGKPVQRHNIFDINQFVFYKMMIVVSFCSFIFNRRKVDISALIFWLVFLVFSLKAMRNVAFFGLAGYLVVITNFVSVGYKDFTPFRFTDKKFECLTAIFISCLYIAWLFQFGMTIATRSYYDFDAYKYKSEFWGVGQRNYPNKAADFLVDNNLRGNFFNDFNSGAYLLGRAHPGIKVFIDGRTEVYGSEFFKKYRMMWNEGNAQLLDEAIEKFGITGALLNSATTPIPIKILNYFNARKEWVLVYLNYDGVVFLKNVPQNHRVIEQHGIDFKNWSPADIDLFKFGISRSIPYHQYSRAYTLFNLGEYDLSMQEAQKALLINPQYPEAHHLAGQVYIKKNNYEKAFESFRIAAMLDPFDKKIRYNFAHIYLDLKQYEGAIEQYSSILEVWPNEVEARFRLAQAYAYSKNASEALRHVDGILKIDPKALGDILLIGDAFYETGQYRESLRVYEHVNAVDKNYALVYKKMAFAYNALGEKEKAVASGEKYLSLSPDDKEMQAFLGNFGVNDK